MPSAHATLPFWLPIAFFPILILLTAEAVIFLGGACRARSILYPDADWLGKAGTWVGFAAGGVVSTLVALEGDRVGGRGTRRMGPSKVSGKKQRSLGGN